MERDAAQGWCVLKFGGTSVASAERWEQVLGIVTRRLDRGERPLVVCSAVAGTTDDLEALPDRGPEETRRLLRRIRDRHAGLARDLGLDLAALPDLEEQLTRLEELALHPPGGEWSPRARARLLGQGELLSTRLGAAWLVSRGVSVRWLDARDVLRTQGPARTERDYLSAECEAGFSEPARRSLDGDPCSVVITQGFLARDVDGETVVLGRGGSDTAAAYFASRIGAKRVEIWTDVPGLFTANPRKVPNARLIRRLTYDEAETLATMGAAALHPRSIRPVREAGIPMEIAWTDRPELEGTVIASGAGDPGIKAISSRNGLCLVSMRRPPSWQPVGFMADIAECFRRHDLCMDLVSSSPSDIRSTVDLEADPGAPDRIDDLLRNLNQVSRASLIPDVASVSLVGRQIRSTLPAVAETLQHLEGHPIHLLAQSANDYSLAYVTEHESELPLVRAMHEELFGDIPLCETFGPSWESLTRGFPASRNGNGNGNGSGPESKLAVAS